MLTIIYYGWTLAVLIGCIIGLVLVGMACGIMYTQMEEDEYENGKLIDKIFMKVGAKIVNYM